MLNRFNSDLRSAWRGVLAGRLSSIVAVTVLAVGTGASVTASAVAYAGLLRPLPFPEADRLFTLTRLYAPTSVRSGVTLSDFDRWRERLSNSLLLTGYSSERTTLRGGAAPSEVRAAYVAGNWFHVLGARSRFGRLIDDTSPVDEAVVSGAFADRMSRGDPATVIGRAFTIGTRPLRVVGVLPATFNVICDADIWMLARGAGALQIVGKDDSRYYQMVARVAPGRSIDSARAAVGRLQCAARSGGRFAGSHDWMDSGSLLPIDERSARGRGVRRCTGGRTGHVRVAGSCAGASRRHTARVAVSDCRK